ncbi:MAG: hypothetical protein ACRD7E_00080 [Bryobacteraceae bacterium]
MCRWMNGDVSFVSARTKEDAIIMLDEWDDAEGAEISQIRDFMVDFRLNDEGELELKEFGENCRDSILKKAYPRLLEAMSTAPMTPTGGPTAEGTEMIRNAVEEERMRPLTPARVPQPATEAARELQRKMGASAAYANRAVEEMASELLAKAPTTGRKQ